MSTLKVPGGFCIWLTGLSGAGKTTLAREIIRRHETLTMSPMTLIDGDEARKTLCSELGFSRPHRDLSVSRLALVASLIVRHGGACVVAAITPYKEARSQAIRCIEDGGLTLLVHVSTPLDVCEARDAKGLYAQARSGALSSFTGVSDPYEIPLAPDLSLDLEAMDVERACKMVEHALSVKRARAAHRAV